MGAKIAVAAGFVLLAVGLSVGATTGVGSSGLFVAVWMAVVGAGMGLAMATSDLGRARRAVRRIEAVSARR